MCANWKTFTGMLLHLTIQSYFVESLSPNLISVWTNTDLRNFWMKAWNYSQCQNMLTVSLSILHYLWRDILCPQSVSFYRLPVFRWRSCRKIGPWRLAPANSWQSGRRTSPSTGSWGQTSPPMPWPSLRASLLGWRRTVTTSPRPKKPWNSKKLVSRSFPELAQCEGYSPYPAPSWSQIHSVVVFLSLWFLEDSKQKKEEKE